MTRRSIAILVLVAAVILPGRNYASSAAPLRLPSIFSDHMVLQRDMPVPVWGWAEPGETVEVTAGGVTVSTKADESGRWMVKLGAMEASDAVITVTVSTSSKTITFKDVLVGDVWLCSGQSNMALPLSNAGNAKEELARADRPALRLFKVKIQTSDKPQEDCTGQWQVSSAQSAGGFSAVGYFFGKEIAESQKVPVGMIDSSLGATPGQAWVSADCLKADADLDKTYLAPAAPLLADPSAAKAAHDKWLAECGADYKAAMQKYYADNYTAQKSGQPGPQRPVPPAAPEPLYFDDAVRFPTVLYNGMISPLAPYAIKGATWYQGESNSGGAALYGKLLTTLIHCWRDRWQQGDFAFYIVQLPNYGKRIDHPEQLTGGWPLVREQERLVAASVSNAGLAVTIDIGEGNNLHPPFKSEVGRRLALAARQDVYGEKITGTSPVPVSWTVDGGKMLIRFTQVGEGLKIGVPPAGSKTPIPATDTLKGFAMAGSDHKFVWAQAVIEGTDTVAVWSDEVKTPAAVRYGWGADPEVNLYNSTDLPASPFSADSAPPMEAGK